MEDGKIRYTWPEDNGDRLTVMGKFKHMREIKYHTEAIFEPKKAAIWEEYEELKKNNDFLVRPPPRLNRLNDGTGMD